MDSEVVSFSNDVIGAENLLQRKDYMIGRVGMDHDVHRMTHEMADALPNARRTEGAYDYNGTGE